MKKRFQTGRAKAEAPLSASSFLKRFRTAEEAVRAAARRSATGRVFEMRSAAMRSGGPRFATGRASAARFGGAGRKPGGGGAVFFAQKQATLSASLFFYGLTGAFLSAHSAPPIATAPVRTASVATAPVATAPAPATDGERPASVPTPPVPTPPVPTVPAATAPVDSSESSQPLSRRRILAAKTAPVTGRVFVTGNRLIETELIKKHLRLKAGAPYSAAAVRAAVRRLYSLGFFQEIEARLRWEPAGARKKAILQFQVREKPLIAEIKFEGVHEFSDEDLKKLLVVQAFEFLNFKKLEESAAALKKKYKESGYFLSDISFELQNFEKGKTRLIVKVREGERVFIKRIQFIGVRAFSSQKLRSLMKTRKRGILSFLDSSGVFHPADLERDIRLIEYFYRDKGFLNVQPAKPEVSLSTDKKSLYISLTVKEGARFTVGQVNFEGDEIVSSEEAEASFRLKSSEFFSLGRLLHDLKRTEDFYKEKGYAFAKAFPEILPDPNKERHVRILIKAEKGRLYKAGKIKIFGNQETRDKVILRQFTLKEGGEYKKSLHEESEALIRRLGFFEKAEIKLSAAAEEKSESPEPDGAEAQNKEPKNKEPLPLTLEAHVQEKEHTGEAMLAGGFNSLYKGFVRGGLKKSNFLGLGHSLSLQVSFSRYQELFNFNYHNPYFWDTDWSFSADIFNKNQARWSDYDNFLFSSENDGRNILDYSQMNRGFAFSLGRSLTDYFSVSLKYGLQRQLLSRRSFLLSETARRLLGGEETDKSPAEAGEKSSVAFVVDDIFPLEEAEGLISSVTGTALHDKRNDRFHATDGYYGRLSLEYAGLGGDFDWTKILGTAAVYQKLFWKLVLKSHLNFGRIFSHSRKPVPFTELFLLGGPYSLRGFFPNTVGPRKYSQKAYDYAVAQELENPQAFALRPYGGSKMFYVNVETEAPLVKEAGLFAAAFLDLGEAADRLTFQWDNKRLDKGLRANVGAGVRWRSPFGLIRLDWGFPFFPKEELNEEKMQFQFSIGSAF